jgi:hypothetical protein
VRPYPIELTMQSSLTPKEKVAASRYVSVSVHTGITRQAVLSRRVQGCIIGAYVWRLAYSYRRQLSAEVNVMMEMRLALQRRSTPL